MTSDAPWFSDPLSVMLFFLASLVLLHVLLIKIIRLDRRAWKRTDYLWLSIGILGLYGTSISVRIDTSEALIERYESDVRYRFGVLRSQIVFLTGPVVCRDFIRNSLSPTNLEAVQAEYNKACEYTHRLLNKLPLALPSKLDTGAFQDRPDLTDVVLLSVFSELDRSLAEYLSAQGMLTTALNSSKRSPTETYLSRASIVLLTIALALRITKVSGELRLEAS